MYDIRTDYFEGFNLETERLDIHLNPSLRDRVVDNFKKMADFYLGPSFEKVMLDIIHSNIEASCPDATPQDIAEACEKAKTRLVESAKFRFSHKEFAYEEPCRQVSEAAMMRAYQKAKQRTLVERISQLNKADVLAFYYALLRKTVWDCKQVIEDSTIQFIKKLLENIKENPV